MSNYFKLGASLVLFACVTTNASENSAKQTKSLSLTQSILVGGTVGAAEVALPGQILSYAMNRAVQQKPFVWRDSYKGFGANAG